MSSVRHILVANPCGNTGLLVAESLRAQGLEVTVMEGPNARKHEGEFLKKLRLQLDGCGAGMVIPTFFPEVLAAHRDRFPDILIPVESAEKLQLLDNKLSCSTLAASLGIPQPRRFSGFDEVKQYPVVFKRPCGQGGDSVYFPGNPRALRNILAPAKEFLLTEYIDGYDVCVDALRWDGFFFAASYRVLEPLRKGVSTLRESLRAPELEAWARQLLDAVDYHGVCGLDFRIRAADGRAFFLECNPRFSGGLASALSSGFDIPALLWRLATGEQVDAAEIVFREGVITR
ncbi:MAG: ATP-grasp domain-containing protein [Bacteroidales bacterium]|nr:ATP-grasp domain-containing protein [Bacteroidales bacterium]